MHNAACLFAQLHLYFRFCPYQSWNLPSEKLEDKLQRIEKILEEIIETTRPPSDSEAVTMYKLKGKSSNMQSSQGFKWKELVRPAGLSSWSVQLVHQAGPSSWFFQLGCPAGLSSKVHVLQSAKNKVSSNGNYILHFQFYPLHLMHCIWHIA